MSNTKNGKTLKGKDLITIGIQLGFSLILQNRERLLTKDGRVSVFWSLTAAQ